MTMARAARSVRAGTSCTPPPLGTHAHTISTGRSQRRPQRKRGTPAHAGGGEGARGQPAAQQEAGPPQQPPQPRQAMYVRAASAVRRSGGGGDGGSGARTFRYVSSA